MGRKLEGNRKFAAETGVCVCDCYRYVHNLKINAVLMCVII